MLDFIKNAIEKQYKTKSVMVEDDFMDYVIRIDFELCDIHIVVNLRKDELPKESDPITMFVDYFECLEVAIFRAINIEIMKIFEKE